MGNYFWKDVHLNYTALAIPAFFLFAGLEYIAARERRGRYFSFDSSIANISIGIAERLLNLFITASFYEAFVFVYEHYALWSIPNHWTVWVFVLLATDLVWYWYHRLGHEVNILWAAHVVHHQSEEFNYTVSARITVFQACIRNVFWCVLPLAGFHPSMVVATLVIHGTYSFFTHTQIIRKLGWFEYIFITPSHHRVHHAANEKYLNKNYGDLFVFWDKLFGTFQKEEEEPVYGLTHPLKSYSFLWQHFHYYMEMLRAMRLRTGWVNKLRVIVENPEKLDPGIRSELEKVYLDQTPLTHSTPRYRVYLVLQLAVSIIVLFVLTLLYRHIPAITCATATLFILVTLVNCGALLEKRTWIFYLESVRLLLMAGYLSYVMDSMVLFVISAVFIVTLGSSLQRWYLKTIYGVQEDTNTV